MPSPTKVHNQFPKGSTMELVMGLVIGLGLSAACGFRVFVPLLGMSIANMAGHLTLGPGFEWIGTWPALVTFGTATAIEVTGYFVPWIDNALDTVATPAAIIAGTIITASQLGDTSPLVKWSLAIIAGGGLCSVIQLGTVATRTLSSGTTGGFGNFLVSGGEVIAASLVTAGALLIPILALLAVIISAVAFIAQIFTWISRRGSTRKTADSTVKTVTTAGIPTANMTQKNRFRFSGFMIFLTWV